MFNQTNHIMRYKLIKLLGLRPTRKQYRILRVKKNTVYAYEEREREREH